MMLGAKARVQNGTTPQVDKSALVSCNALVGQRSLDESLNV